MAHNSNSTTPQTSAAVHPAPEDASPAIESNASSAGSSSQTARDDATNAADGSADRGGGGGGFRATLSSLLPTLSGDGNEQGDKGSNVEHDQQRTDLTMPRSTLNTVPVWARTAGHHHGSSGSAKQSPHQKPADAHSSTWSRAHSSALKKPTPLHLANSKHASTAVATRDFAQHSRAVGSNDVEADAGHGGDASDEEEEDNADRQTLSTISMTSLHEHDDEGVSRFWSFALPGHARRKTLPAKDDFQSKKSDPATTDEEKNKEAPSSDEPQTTRFSDRFSGLASAVSGAFSGYSHDGPQTYDSEAPRQQGGHSYGDGYTEKHMSGEHEGTRGGWSHDYSVDEGRTGNDAGRGTRKPKLDKGDMTGAGTSGYEAFRHRGTSLLPDSSFTRNQQLTPGWESPWRPESRGEHSIKFGKYRFNNHGEGGYFPRSDSSGRKSDEARRRRNASGMSNLLTDPGLLLDIGWWRRFLLHNAFVPLLFRMINIAFTTTTLAIAIKLYRLLQDEGAESAVGSSPIVAIIFAPLTLIHVGIQIYIEYFSRPIGLWRVGSKLFYTLIELVFICLWSAELSLSFDNYFTSTLVCTTFSSPYATDSDTNPAMGEQLLNDPSRKPFICRLQGVLIGLVFTSLLAYIVVFAVSLFRIFVRVKR